MPRISGLANLQELEHRRIEIPTIVISGHFDPEHPRGFPSFVVGAFNKPYGSINLIACVKDHLLPNNNHHQTGRKPSRQK